MSDPILISQIIQSEGLTGKNAEERRAELEKKSNAELQQLLSQSTVKTDFGDNIYGVAGWTPQAKSKPKFTPAQSEAMDFIGQMLSDATKTMNEQAKKENWVSTGVNFVKETFNTEYAKSNVDAAIDSTRRDFEALQDSARKVPSEFESEFKRLRGVKFDEKKIAECSEKAKNMAEFQASTDMIDALKKELNAALVNNSGNNISRSGEKAILKTLSSMGYTKIGEVIQAAMKGHENDPAVKNYLKEGGSFAVKKDKNGQIGIYRETEKGGWQPITQEQAQIIGKEIELRLNKLHSQVLGVEIPENASSEEIAKLNETKLEEYRADYEKSFAQAYGKKDLKQLSENYMLSQEQGQAYVQMGVNMLAMAGAMFSGGGTLALVSTGVMITNPVQFIQMATDADGMTAEDWKNYGSGMLEQAGWMALGMGAGKVGDMARSFVKVKGLSKVVKESGKTLEEFVKTASKSPNIPADMAKSLKTVSTLANTAGVTAEVATDMATTIALQKDGATGMDWAMSVGGALVGTKMQKVLAPMSHDAKVKHVMDTFKDFKLTEDEANQLLKAMDDSQSGAAPLETRTTTGFAGGGGTETRSLEGTNRGPALEGGVHANELDEVAPFARRVQDEPQLGETVGRSQADLDKKDFLKQLAKLKSDDNITILSKALREELFDIYGKENLPQLTKLLDDIEAKCGDNKYLAAYMFKSATLSNIMKETKDFDFLKKLIDRDDIVDCAHNFTTALDAMNMTQKQAIEIMLDMPNKSYRSTGYILDYSVFFDNAKSLDILKRISTLKDADGNLAIDVSDTYFMNEMKDLIAKADFTDKELINLNRNLLFNMCKMDNSLIAKTFAADGNEDLINLLKQCLNKSYFDDNKVTAEHWNDVQLIGNSVRSRVTPAMLINNIEDKNLKSLIKRNVGKIEDTEMQKHFINEVSSYLDLSDIKDEYILGNISRKVAQIAEKLNSNARDKNYVVVNYLNELGEYNGIGREMNGIEDTMHYTDAREYLNYLKTEFPEKAKDFETLVEKYETLSPVEYEKFISDNGYVSKYNQQEFFDSVVNYSQEKNIQSLKYYLKNHYDEKATELTPKDKSFIRKLYTDKYLSTLPEHTRKLCEKIYDSFGVKVFLMDKNDSRSLNMIYNELLEWHKASRGTAVLPPTLDLSLIKQSYIDKVFDSGGFCNTASHNISLRGNAEHGIRHAIRHELAHANDSRIDCGEGLLEVKDKDGNVIETIDIDDIIVHKWKQTTEPDGTVVISKELDSSNLPVPDFDKCKYVEEFRNAGVPEYHIGYAYTNKKEFLAVAAEGDYRTYSPEFKQLLVKLGLPKWMFDMTYKEAIDGNDNVYATSEFSKKYSYKENAAISKNTERLFNFVAKNKDAVIDDYNNAFTIPGTKLYTRVKDFFGLNEKIYREVQKFDDKIADLSDLEKYNREKLKPGDEPLTQAAADELIARYNEQKQRMINDYDMVYDKIQDSFGSRIVMDDTSPAAVAKVHKSLLDAIDRGDFKILEINNYQGTGGTPYFSSAQIKQIQAHCRKAGYEVTVISDVNAPAGKEAAYSKAYNSKKAIKASGYTTCQMNIQHKNGVVSEFQIRGKHLNELAESEHIFYDISQNKQLDKGNPKIKEITDPLVEVVHKMNAKGNEHIKEAYTNYLTDCYKYARSLETGTPMEKPVLPAIVDPMLDIDNIIRIHSIIENAK